MKIKKYQYFINLRYINKKILYLYVIKQYIKIRQLMHILSKPNPKNIPPQIQKTLSKTQQLSLIKQSHHHNQHKPEHHYRYNNRQDIAQPYVHNQNRVHQKSIHKGLANSSHQHAISLHQQKSMDLYNKGKKQGIEELIAKRKQIKMNAKSNILQQMEMKQQNSHQLIYNRYKNRSLHGHSISEHTGNTGLITIQCHFPPNHTTQSDIITLISKTLTFPSTLPAISSSSQPSSKLTSQQLLATLSKSQALQPLSYSSPKFKQIASYIQSIFNKSIDIGERDILIVYGQVMQCYYVFFNSGIVSIGCVQCTKEKKSGIVYAVWREEVKVQERYRIKKGKNIQDDSGVNDDRSKSKSRVVENSRITQLNNRQTANMNKSLDSPYLTSIQQMDRVQSSVNPQQKMNKVKIVDNQTMPLVKPLQKTHKQQSSAQLQRSLLPQDMPKQQLQKTSSMLFTCGKCYKNIFRIIIHQSIENSNDLVHKSRNYGIDNRVKNRKQKYDLQKLKISMCVKIASGKFKNMRISDQQHILKRIQREDSSYDRSQIKSQLKGYRDRDKGQSSQTRKQKNHTQYLRKNAEQKRKNHEKKLNKNQRTFDSQQQKEVNRNEKIKLQNQMHPSQSLQTIFPDIFATKQQIKQMTPQKQTIKQKKLKKEKSQISNLRSNLKVKKNQMKLQKNSNSIFNINNMSINEIGEGNLDLQNISKILEKQKVKAINDKNKNKK